jgi:hypothetical protein
LNILIAPIFCGLHRFKDVWMGDDAWMAARHIIWLWQIPSIWLRHAGKSDGGIFGINYSAQRKVCRAAEAEINVFAYI